MRVVVGDSEEADGGIEHGALLRNLAMAILGEGDLDKARETARQTLGDRKTVHACQVVAAFDGINRVADVAGIRTDDEMTERATQTVTTLNIAAMESL